MKLQQRLFLENIDGTRKFPQIESLEDLGKDGGKYLTHHLFEAYRACGKVFMSKDGESEFINTDSFIDPDKLIDYAKENNLPDKVAQIIAVYLKEDTYTRTACATYKLYKENSGTNYVISHALTKCLEKMCLEVPADALPEKFSAYFEPSGLMDTDGSTVKGAFVYVGEITGHRTIMINIITTDYMDIPPEEDLGIFAYRTFLVPLEKGKTLDLLLEEYNKREKADQTNFETESKDTRPIKELKCLKAIINAILYVTNPNEDFIEQYNEFAKSKKKKEIQEKIYSQKSFVKIGYDNTEFLKMIIEKETTVRWHFRDQPYGPGRTLRKKILIAPHVRKYKNLAT
jgi:hypothetical protein